MGKSSKKVKNDRINTLRKQYDAFLEEDKKRKERNEYILGKLDKMRLSTALVPTVTKVNLLEVNPDIYGPSNNLGKISPMYDNYVSQLQPQNASESNILKDISKKYILIPKRGIGIENKYPYHTNVINDNEWKSKYHILQHLKQQEKEGDTEALLYPSNETFISPQIKPESDTNDKPSYKLDNDSTHFDKPLCNINNFTVNKLNTTLEQGSNNNNAHFTISEIKRQENADNRLPLQIPLMPTNRDFQDNKVEYVYNTNDSVNHKIMEPDQISVTDNEKYNLSSNEKSKVSANNDRKQNMDKHLEIEEENKKTQVNVIENVPQSHYNQLSLKESDHVIDDNVINPTCAEQIVTSSKSLESNAIEFISQNLGINHENQIQLNENQGLAAGERVYDAVENNPEIPINQIAYDTGKYSEPTQHNILTEHENTKHTDKLHLSSDIQQDFNTEGVLSAVVRNPESQIESGHSTYDATQHYEQTEHYEQTQDNIAKVVENTEHTTLEDHESEINAFETEQREMFYDEKNYDDNYAYNQEDGNVGVYPAEDYEQNNQYAYYEGVQQQEVYSTNINEHEESTEQYDPQYNEQYEQSYDKQQPDSSFNYVNTNDYNPHQFQDESYEKQQFENVVNCEKQQEDSTNLYQNDNEPSVNKTQEAIITPQVLNLHTDTSDNQGNIEQQLMAEEGVIKSSENVGEYHKENDSEIINKIIEDAAPAEVIPNIK